MTNIALGATLKNEKWFFLFGFEKGAISNISPQDTEDLKHIASTWLRLDTTALALALDAEHLKEVHHDTEV